MQITKKLSCVALAATACLLSGCSALSIGEEEFSCSGMPGSVYCHSARDVYEKTNGGVVPSPVGKAEGAYNPDCEDCVRAEDINPELAVHEDENSRYALDAVGGDITRARHEETIEVIDRSTGQRRTVKRKSLEVHDDEVINNYVAPRLPMDPVPIRTPAQVMRIWVAPYVDTNGDLVAPGFVYTEIEPRRWIYPDSSVWGNSDRSFTPLWVKKASMSNNEGVPEGISSLEKYKEAQQARGSSLNQ